MLAHEALGVLAGFGDLGDVEARGVGGQQRFLGDDFGDFPEKALLDVHALHGGFHHQTAVPEALLIHGKDHPVQGGLGFLGGDEALLDHHLLVQGDEVFALFDTSLIDVVDIGFVPGQGVYLG